jgi:hypothetical protein
LEKAADPSHLQKEEPVNDKEKIEELESIISGEEEDQVLFQVNNIEIMLL